MTIGSFWGEVALPVELDARATIPRSWVGKPVDLELWLGGEGLVQISTGFQGGLNPMHHRFPVTTNAAGNETVEIHAEVVPKGIFGTNIAEPRLERAALVVPNLDVRALERDLTMIADACGVLHQHEVVPFLLDAVEAAFSVLAPAWPTSTEETVTRYVRGYDDGLGSGTGAVPANWVPEAIDNRRLTERDLELAGPALGVRSIERGCPTVGARRAGFAGCVARANQAGLSADRSALPDRSRAYRSCLAVAAG